jgi:hypothetical protein
MSRTDLTKNGHIGNQHIVKKNFNFLGIMKGKYKNFIFASYREFSYIEGLSKMIEGLSCLIEGLSNLIDGWLG